MHAEPYFLQVKPRQRGEDRPLALFVVTKEGAVVRLWDYGLDAHPSEVKTAALQTADTMDVPMYFYGEG